MKKIFIALLVLLFVSLPVAAQSFNPVLEENSVDGLLLGAEGSYKFFNWLEPSLGLAYGLQSQKIRYRAGVGVWDVKLSLVDWPGTPVLGYVGETGFKATLKLPWDLPTVSGFLGTLWPWPHDPNPPDIAYVTWASGQSFRGPFDIELGISGRTLQGWWRLGAEPVEFGYTRTDLSLSWEGFRLGVSYGSSHNEGRLPDFIFVQGVKGDSETIQGEQFWSVQFERAFDVLAVPMPIPLLPKSLEFLVQGAVFVQVASAAKTELPSDSQEGKLVWQNRLSWGVSALLLLDRASGIKARADFVFTRDGRFQFLFSF